MMAIWNRNIIGGFRRWLLSGITVVSGLIAAAQSDAQFTQYFEIPTYYNPGAIGTTDYLRIRGGSRLQWVGIEKAPRAFMATADTPFKLFNKRFGVGLAVQQGSQGLYNELRAGLQIGYQFKLLKGVFSVGAQVGLLNETFKGSEVYIPDDDDYHESTDEAIPTMDVTGNGLDLGLGVWYTHNLFWTGLSVSHLNAAAVRMKKEGSESNEQQNFEFNFKRTFYLTAGSNIQIKNTLFEVIPSLLVKSDLTFTSFELTGRIRYNKFLSAGLAYRYNDAVSLMLGVDFKNFYLGYSYDYATTAIARASSGSHEIFVGYRMKLDFSEKNRHRHKSIRIM